MDPRRRGQGPSPPGIAQTRGPEPQPRQLSPDPRFSPGRGTSPIEMDSASGQVPGIPGQMVTSALVHNPCLGQNPGLLHNPGLGQNPGFLHNPSLGQNPGLIHSPGLGQNPGLLHNPGLGQNPGLIPNPGLGQNPGFSGLGQGNQFVTEGVQILNHGFVQNPGLSALNPGRQFRSQGQGVGEDAEDQPQDQPVMGMSRLQELSGEVYTDCPGAEPRDDSTFALHMAVPQQGMTSPPMNMMMVPGLVTSGSSISPMSQFSQPGGGAENVMVVPPGGPPVMYSGMQQFPSQGLVMYPGSVGVQQPQGTGPAAVPPLNVSHGNTFCTPPPGQPAVAMHQPSSMLPGVSMQSLDLGGQRLGHLAVRGPDSQGMVPDDPVVQSFQGLVIDPNSAAQGSGVVGYQPGWIKAQLMQAPLAPSLLTPSYPALDLDNRPCYFPTHPSSNSYRANPVEARFRSLYPMGYPSLSRSSEAQLVKNMGRVRFSPVVPAAMMQHHTGRYGRRSVPMIGTRGASTESQFSSVRLSQDPVGAQPSPNTEPVASHSSLMAQSLLHVHIPSADGSRLLGDVVRQFMQRTYGQLWHQTFCVPHKASVSQHHPDKALVRTREGQFRVSLALEQLSIHKQEHMFLLCDYHYESFLNLLNPAKIEVSELVKEKVDQLRVERQFGDFDLLVFHPERGLLVFTLCSVNSNSDVQYILKRIQKSRMQLDKSAAVAQRYVTVLGLECPVSRIYCTPNLKRVFLNKVTQRDKQTSSALSGMTILCSDQLPTQFKTMWLDMKSFSIFTDWWASIKATQGSGGQVRLDDLTLLLGCFLCPSVSKIDFDQSSPPSPAESRPLTLENAAASPVTTRGAEHSVSPSREFDVSNLVLTIGNNTKAFFQYMEEYVDLYYPHLMKQTYRVPPIHFNIQKVDTSGKYDVLERPMSKDTRGDEGENRVVGAIEILGLKYSAVRPVFIICDFQYNNYLNKLKENMFVKGDDRRPRRAYGQSVRAQHDCLLIHRRYGIIIISVKAVGDNFEEWASSGSDKWRAVKNTLGKVLKQLPREHTMVNMVLGDLTSDLPVIKLIALPNLHRRDVNTAISDDKNLQQDIENMFPGMGTKAFLCKDELCETGASIWEELEERPDFFSNLCDWWDRAVGKGSSKVLSKQLYKQIIGRFCGLLSTVEVWSMQSPRVEVRNTVEAVQETAERFSRILLTKEQVDILSQPYPRLYLSGPPGTGKTMLLVLRARQWLEEERRSQVVILNLRHGSKGLPLGHLLQEQISQLARTSPQHSHTHNSKEGPPSKHHAVSIHSPAHTTSSPTRSPQPQASAASQARVLRFDVDSRVFDGRNPGKLTDIPRGAYIVVDEITPSSHLVLKWVMETHKPRAVWCVGQFRDYCPQDFEPEFMSVSLNSILRCPPMVQRVLQHTSHALGSPGKETRMFDESYVPSSAPYGLATDGSRPWFIFHSQHNSSSRHPVNCASCGSDLADYLLHHLQVQSSSYDQAKRRRLGPLPATTEPLSLKDVVIVCREVQSCAFITGLRKKGLPVAVVTETTNRSVAMPTQEVVVFTTPFAMTGLERKVVVYVAFESSDPLERTEDVEEKGQGRERDDLKVGQALKELTSEDHVSLWYTASRCTAQLIIVVP